MFGLSGTPSLPDARWALTMLVLVGFVVLGVRNSALFGRGRTAEDRTAQRTTGWQIGLVTIAGWLAFMLLVTDVGVAKLVPRLLAP
jgi:hypothetical protein